MPTGVPASARAAGLGGAPPVRMSPSPPAAILDAYGSEDVVVGERLEGGYANDLFRVSADGERFVLRIKHPPACEDDVAWEHRLTRRLAQRLPEVVTPLVARDGATAVRVGDRLAWLLPFVDGEPADPARERHRLAAARGLGRLHRAGEALSLSPRPRLTPLAGLGWPPLVVVPELEEWADAIADARAWAIDHVAGLAGSRRLAKSVVHGDYFPGNVLVADDELAAIVDWEEAQVDWVVWDLANALGSFCSVEDQLDVDAARAFVSRYRECGGTAAADDDDLLVPLLRVKRILEVLRAPTDREPRWDHQLHNLRSLGPLAETRLA